MKKAKIIYGEGSCGKTTLAQSISYNNGGAYFYGTTRDIPWVKANLTTPFKTIIIDECPEDFQFESFFDLIADLPDTQFVFVTESDPSFTGASFEARFDLIDARAFWEDLPF